MAAELAENENSSEGFLRRLGLLDSTMIVAGSMIGSGIFIVSADISRQLGAPGWLILAWVFTGLLTIAAALSYGELAAMMPKAGGQYVYLREAFSPIWGFLYGWTLFLVIQTGTIAAVAVGFARFIGVLFPKISKGNFIIEPIHLTQNYAISLSTQQLVAILLIVFLTVINIQGLKLGKWIQNLFTSAKTLSLIALIALGIIVGAKMNLFGENFSNLWTIKNAAQIKPDLTFVSPISATDGMFGLLIAFCVAQVGSLFSADAWNNITFTAGEVKNPKRNIGLSLLLGTLIVTIIYVAANLMYLNVLPLNEIASAPQDRVAVSASKAIFGNMGTYVIAVMIMISTFGCNNGLILAGARVYNAMAKDGLFFKQAGLLNKYNVPEFALWIQCIVASLLCLSGKYGDLLDMISFVVVMFYALTILGIFILRKNKPELERPYKAFGYPLLPAIYILMAIAFCILLIWYKPVYAGWGLGIVLAGIPLYYIAVSGQKSAKG